MTASAIMGMLPEKIGKTDEASSILFLGQELVGCSMRKLKQIRGNDISMVMQDAMTALNPVLPIKKQMVETLKAHRRISTKDAVDTSIEMLRKVGIPAPEIRINDYPHQLSGGMKQRVIIAMALLCEPKLIIADEPTTALDVTIQAQILDLLKKIRDEMKTAIILITHDMGVVANTADRVLVMYSGQLVEYTDVNHLFEHPRHPYSVGLLNSIPRLDVSSQNLTPIPGTVPGPDAKITGCRFSTRCPYATSACREQEPALYRDSIGAVKCLRYQNAGAGETS